jgi:CBS domain-containing protein
MPHSSHETDASLASTQDTAEELMTPNPVSVRAGATIPEVLVLFANRGVNAAAVVDEAGRPVGVVSRTDILIHEREKTCRTATNTDGTSPAEVLKDIHQSGTPAASVDSTLVQDIMTPAVFAVPPDYPVNKVVEDMLRLKVHQLYVVDRDGILVGLVEGQTVLDHLHGDAGDKVG